MGRSRIDARNIELFIVSSHRQHRSGPPETVPTPLEINQVRT
jgi:hypothetical protein